MNIIAIEHLTRRAVVLPVVLSLVTALSGCCKTSGHVSVDGLEHRLSESIELDVSILCRQHIGVATVPGVAIPTLDKTMYANSGEYFNLGNSTRTWVGDNGTYYFEIQSETGGGTLSLLRPTNGVWPDRIVLHLHTTGHAVLHMKTSTGLFATANRDNGHDTPGDINFDVNLVESGADPESARPQNPEDYYLFGYEKDGGRIFRHVSKRPYFSIVVPHELMVSSSEAIHLRWLDWHRR